MSDTTGWTREDGVYMKAIGSHCYKLYLRETGFFPGQWIVFCDNIAIHDKYSGYRKISDAKRAAHRHAEEHGHG